VKLRTFTGFRGTAALMQIGQIKFLVLAKNAAHLEALHARFGSDGPFNPEACQASIIIQATVLPKTKQSKPKPNHEQSNPDQSSVR